MDEYYRLLGDADDYRQRAESYTGWQRREMLKAAKMFESRARHIKRLIDNGYDWDAPPPS
jgi:hypothetical protein